MSDAPEWLSELADGSLDDVSEVAGDRLLVPSGRLVACDPLVFLSTADPFAREVPPGAFPVSVGRLPEGENAYAVVRFGEGRVARWEVARCPGEEDVEGWPGYGVDSGLGCFADLEAVRAWAREDDELHERVGRKVADEGIPASDVLAYHEAFERIRAELGGEDPLATLEGALRRKPTAGVRLSPGSDGNLVAFRSGAGEGVFASFWGLDEAGRPLALVTDFGLLSEDDEELEGDEDDLGELGDLDEEELEDEPLGGLGDLEALAAALGIRPEPEPETRQGPSPLFAQTRQLLQKWIDEEKVELEEDADFDQFAEHLLEKLVSLSGKRHPGAHLAEWMLERSEVADVYATDEELEADLRPD